MSPHSQCETIEAGGARVALRRLEGPLARELFLLAEPAGAPGETAACQARAVYRALGEALRAEGAGFASVLTETAFLRSMSADLEAVRGARAQVRETCGAGAPHRPAFSEVEQPPLDEAARLQVAVHAVVPWDGSLHVTPISAPATCDCGECAGARALRVALGTEVRFHAAGLHGRGEDAYAQTHAMFAAAEALLERSGMTFRDVVRTWIHLREMDRDYPGLNRARREFFEARGIDPPPASTGIGGAPAGAAHDLSLAVHAIQDVPPPERAVMSASTLNEAPEYGSDFARGMCVVEANKVALHVSGTASIDEAGHTAHPGDFDAQADRMLQNVAALLERQGAGFGDVVSAITYLKRPADAERLRARMRAAGYEGFPNALVVAPVCRPDLLCETEALAVLPCNPAGISRRS